MFVTRQKLQQPDILVVLGRNAILTHDEQFIQGYQNGYLHFHQTYDSTLQADGSIAPFSLSDDKVARFFFQCVTDVHHPPHYQAGLLIGWNAALLEEQPGTAHQLLSARQTRTGEDERQQQRSR